MAYTTPGETRERVYEYVRRRLLEGRPPTVREVQRAFGFRAVGSAYSHLSLLVEEGRLMREAGHARSYTLPPTPAQRPPRLIPLVGRVQAGDLSLALESPEGYVAVETSRHLPDDLFALTVQGKSMIGANILPGDIVVVRRQSTADSGDIVVALVQDEATVKRLRLRRGRVELHPENPRFKPILPDPEMLSILGKVIEVRRYLEP